MGENTPRPIPDDYADMNRDELIKLAIYQRERMEEMESARKESDRKNAELTDKLSALTEQLRKNNEAMSAMATQVSELMRQLKAEREEGAKLRSEVKVGRRHLFGRKSQKGTKAKDRDDENRPTPHTDVKEDFDGTPESLPDNLDVDVENKTSAIYYLEVGQEVTVRYGYEMPNGSIYWMDGCVCNLADWEADDEEMSFSAKDKIDDLSETYYRGQYRAEGISLYDLAVDVFTDAGLDSRYYELDEYLKTVTVYNPIPCVTHKECLQIIANAGRCRLYQNRQGIICIQAAFTTVISPERMEVTSEDAAEWSNLPSVVNGATKYEYATLSQDHYRMDGTMYFLPRSGSFLPAGFVSRAVSDGDGKGKSEIFH